MQYTEYNKNGKLNTHVLFPRPHTTYADIMAQKKQEVPMNNNIMYKDGVPITATVVPKDTNIHTHFKDFTVPETKTDRHAIARPEDTKRSYSVYEQPDMSIERRELISTTRNDLQLPDTMQHVSKYPETGGYHDTGDHPEVRFNSERASAFPVPMSSVTGTGVHRGGRELNVRLNSNRGSTQRSMAEHRHEDTYYDRPQNIQGGTRSAYTLNDSVKVTGRSNLDSPAVQAARRDDTMQSYGQSTAIEEGERIPFNMETHDNQLKPANPRIQQVPENVQRGNVFDSVYARTDDNRGAGQTVISMPKVARPEPGEISASDMSLRVDHIGNIMGRGDRTGLHNAALRTDESHDITHTTMAHTSRPAVPASIQLGNENTLTINTKTIRASAHSDTRDSRVRVKDKQLENPTTTSLNFGVTETAPTPDCRLTEDNAHMLRFGNQFDRNEGGQRQEMSSCKRVADQTHGKAYLSMGTQKSAPMGETSTQKPDSLFQVVGNVSGFIKGLFGDTKTTTRKNNNMLPTPLDVEMKDSTVSTSVQPPSKITLAQLAKGGMTGWKGDLDHSAKVRVDKPQFESRIPGGNRPSLGIRNK